ncbi:MAG: hypothetical protein A2Y72_02215 [Chloroflexi bacterium RBG_13_53_26]|nr:MAG: hypothetical protein A2Y72_02215 [Chloroflexi bacterium RBG_13_53_26]
MQDLNDKITGNTLTASEWNQVPSEIQNVIEGLGIALSGADLNQLGKAIAGYVANGTFYTDSGAANTYVLTQIGLKKAAPAYTDGMKVTFLPGAANTGASTVNVATLGVKSILNATGDSLPAGSLTTTAPVTMQYNAAAGHFRLIRSSFMETVLDAATSNAALTTLTATRAETGAIAVPVITMLRRHISIEDFGGVGDGATDNTAAFNSALAAAVASTHRRLIIPAGSWLFNSKPNDIAAPVMLLGEGMSNTILVRNYTEATSTKGLIKIICSAGHVRDLAIIAASGTTGGACLSAASTAAIDASGLTLENIWLSTYGGASGNNLEYGLYIDGTAKTSAPAGARTNFIKNAHVFGANQANAALLGCVGLVWEGGGLYQAGSTTGGTLYIGGDATVKSSYVNVHVSNIGGKVQLSNCEYCRVVSPSITGDIENADTCTYSTVHGKTFGTNQNNWVSSGLTWPEILVGVVSFATGAIAAGGYVSTTIAVPGAAAGDFVEVSFVNGLANCTLTGYVSAADTVTAVFTNPTAGALNLGTSNLRCRVTKPAM